MKIFSKVILLSVFILSFLSACEKDYYQTKVVITDSVSFSVDIVPLLESECAISGCHVTGLVAPDLTPANSYDQLTLLGYVDTTNAEESILYKRIIKDMPPSGLMTQEEIAYVLAWIEQGAQNN